MAVEMFRHLVRAFGVAAHFMRRGKMLIEQKRPADAIVWLDRALEYDPWNAEIFYRRGNAHMALGRLAAAESDYAQAISHRADYADALFNRGLALQRMGQFDAALGSYARVLAIKPDDAEALNNRGNVLQELQRNDEALTSYDQALAVRPYYVDALHNRAVVLMLLGRPAAAVTAYRNLLAIAPDHPWAAGRLLQAALTCCDWSRYREMVDAVEQGIDAGRSVIEPFAYLAAASSPQRQRRCAEIFGAGFAATPLPPAPRRTAGGRIRIGYVAGEFRNHATGILMAELFERHDKSRFELIAFDKGGDDGSALRQRICRAFDEMVDIRSHDDDAAAGEIRARQIDLLVDLNGFTGTARPGIFVRRPAAVQINYQIFPGTLALPCFDYLIADRIVAPPEHAAFYSEQIVYLPDCYQVTDSRRGAVGPAPSRAECGLPEGAFVFCCFNNNYKITPAFFDIWMRLLNNVAGSVLWLFEDNPDARANLRREAAARGVDAQRLVFAPRTDLERHLARHRCADLFLDTLPCCAHTGASDALWAGLPLLTCLGETFTGRVAASVLSAAGLPELITTTAAEYEARALELATSPAQLAAIRNRIAASIGSSALYDTACHCRHLETAYTTMWQRHLRGEAPATFRI
jgi:predicted O-linked N-acetylglucosamine transferase (SPINDLY family)